VYRFEEKIVSSKGNNCVAMSVRWAATAAMILIVAIAIMDSCKSIPSHPLIKCRKQGWRKANADGICKTSLNMQRCEKCSRHMSLRLTDIGRDKDAGCRNFLMKAHARYGELTKKQAGGKKPLPSSILFPCTFQRPNDVSHTIPQTYCANAVCRISINSWFRKSLQGGKEGDTERVLSSVDEDSASNGLKKLRGGEEEGEGEEEEEEVKQGDGIFGVMRQQASL